MAELDTSDNLWSIALHLTFAARVHGSLRSAALSAWERAARHASEVNAHSDAARHLEEAVSLATEAERPHLLVELGRATLRAGQPAAAQAHFEAASVIAIDPDLLAAADDLRSLVARLTGNGVEVQFVKEQLTFTGADNPMGTLLLSVMGAFAEFERSLIRERQREGTELARRRGAYRGRPKALNDKQTVELRRRAGAGEQKALLAREFGISRQTVYEYPRAATSTSV